MPKIAILYTDYTPTIDAIKLALNGAEINCFTSIDNDFENYDLVAAIEYKGEIPLNTICVHHSLLPAFNTKNPVKDAIIYGAKVTGITVFYSKPFRVIAQYPVFIYNDSHYDEIKHELQYIEQAFLPLVIKKILNNEPFESQKLMQNSYKGGCSSCLGCGKTD